MQQRDLDWILFKEQKQLRTAKVVLVVKNPPAGDMRHGFDS